MEQSGGVFAEQVIRPTGLIDPPVEVRPAKAQVDDVVGEIRETTAKGYRTLVTELPDPGDDLQASHPLRDAKVTVEDIEDNPGFFRVKLYAVPHFQVEGMDVNLSLVSQMPKAKA